MTKVKGKKPKKTCRCRCGRKYRPERVLRMSRLPNGRRVLKKSGKPVCVGFCDTCHNALMREIGLDA